VACIGKGDPGSAEVKNCRSTEALHSDREVVSGGNKASPSEYRMEGQ
jgi:hypothetical protein